MRAKLLRVLAHLNAARTHLIAAKQIWSGYHGLSLDPVDFAGVELARSALATKVKTVYADEVERHVPEAEL